MAAAALVLGCGDSNPEPRAPAPPPRVEAPPLPVAQLTGWPSGLGRALAVRLGSTEDAYRLVVPELGDTRFADSSISVKVGDAVPVSLLGLRGRVGAADLRVADAEAGTGACVTWPSVEIVGASYARKSGAAVWRVAMERDSVIPVPVDSLFGMTAADSLRLTNAIRSLASRATAASDTVLRGIPFAIVRAYSFRTGGVSVVVAELRRTSSSEADPREERLFVIGEHAGEESTPRLVYSRSAAGPADNTPVTELLTAVVSRHSRRIVVLLGVETGDGLRLHFVERVGRGQWRPSWSSVVNLC